MGRNLSVDQFQDLMKSIPKKVADELKGAPQKQAEVLVGVMKSVVPTGIDGYHELQESIRTEEGSKPLQVYVKAGGPMTTKALRKGSGKDYDYSIAVEFGTKKMNPKPFFWPSYRLMKKKMRAAISRDVKTALAKVVTLK